MINPRGCYWCAHRKGLKCKKNSAVDLGNILKIEKKRQLSKNLKRVVKGRYGALFYIGDACNSFIDAEEIPEEQVEQVIFT